MVSSAYCPTCGRTVYLGSDQAMVCPVCATLLVAPSGDRQTVDERVARNESISRKVNEDIEQAAKHLGETAAAELDFICECAVQECEEPIRMSLEDYAKVRSDPYHFMVMPEHEVAGSEVIVERRPGYHIVEKVGLYGEIAKNADRRNEESG